MNEKLRIHIVLAASIIFSFIMSIELFAQINIYHNPFGSDNLYEQREVLITGNECEREPRDPMEGDEVYIQFKTYPIFNRQECFVDVWENGVSKSVTASFEYNHSGESYWKAGLGKFMQGDLVQYQVRTNFQNEAQSTSQKFSFTTLGWDYILDVQNVIKIENGVRFECSSTNPNLNPVISFEFNSDKTIRTEISVNHPFTGDSKTTQNFELIIQEEKVVLSNSNVKIEVYLKPFSYKVISATSATKVAEEFKFANHGSIGFWNDGKNIFKVSESFYTPHGEEFYGFGERYNAINQRGNEIDNYTANIWREQDKETYIPVPFYLTNTGYGFFVKTYYYVKFDLDSKSENKCEIISNFGRKDKGSIEYYLFVSEEPNKIISEYSSVTGMPEDIPVWTLGPWISANEWDKQSEIEAQIDSLNKYDIPNTVVVIEAWSDEETFYIFNDAKYKLKPAGESYSLKDFEFTGRWPDPIGMINDLHKNQMRLVLWNIPVLKSSGVINAQRDLDEQFAIDNNFVVKNPDGSPNRLPNSVWFSNSLNIDFTNKDAVNWWLANRKYLVDELGIDGFKTDGGEFIWGRDLVFSDGRKGDEMRNCYSEIYVDEYYKFIKSIKNDGVVFHRAGTFGAQRHPLAWNGDQNSTFKAFKEAIRSCLNFAVSGIPFVAYDFAGYYLEDELTPELYKRSLAQAAFSPVMQFHSAYSGDPDLERSPWGIAFRLNAPSCIDVYKKYANLRFNIIPYLYTETRYTAATAYPLMRPLFTEYPDDTICAGNEFDYLLGRSLLVLPVTDSGVYKMNIYLPEGTWYDFWNLNQYAGSNQYEISVPEDHLPLFIKSGSVLPLNLDNEYNLARNMNNDLKAYSNLSFFVFPNENIKYVYFDYTNDTQKQFNVISDDEKIEIEIPGFESTITVIVKTPFAGFEDQTNADISKTEDWESFLIQANSYYYDLSKQLLYVKLNHNMKNTKLIILTK